MNTGYSRPLPDPTATLYAGEDTLQRMVNAVEKVRDRLKRSLVTSPRRTRVSIDIVKVVTSADFVVPTYFHFSPTISPWGGCFSPASESELPPNGMQKKSPRRALSTGAGIADGFSSCQGLTW